MSRKTYHTLQDVLRSPWAIPASRHTAGAHTSDRVLRSTRLEDRIYSDLRSGDDAMEQIERASERKLPSFSALSRDVFQSFYSLAPRRAEAEDLSAAARIFNAPILDHVTQSEDYPTLKNVCEGRQLPAYEAAAEFIARIGGELDKLLKDLGGEKGSGSTLEKLERAREKAIQELSALLERQEKTGEQNPMLEKAIVDAANTAESKTRQAEAVGKLIAVSAVRNAGAVAELVSASLHAAAERAQEAQNIIAAWSDSPGSMGKNEVNLDLLERVRGSQILRRVAMYLGRFREILAQGRRNGYTYGRGETYSLELGNSISRALTSELALLAAPESIPLFMQKYQRKQIKQYRRREPIYKGAGDIICCLDESDSTEGDPAAWGKAVALTLLEIAEDGGRRFALIHFSDASSLKVDLFLPSGLGQGWYSPESKMKAAETFLGGGTNFEAPMRQAVDLIERQGFENADIVFITDGKCRISEKYLEELRTAQAAHHFTVTGILLDQDDPGMEFSLREFCQRIYRTSELTGDQIVQGLVGDRC